MTKQVTATEAKAKLLALLDEVENGEEIVITRHGRTIAKISQAHRPHGLKDKFAGVTKQVVPDEELFSTGVTWDLQ